MKKHLSIHPITKERFVDNFNIDDFRYYKPKALILDITIGILSLFAFSFIPEIRTFAESMSVHELITLCLGYFIITLGIMYIYVLPAVNKRYKDALAIVLPRHITPILLVYIIATVIPSIIPQLGIFSINDKLIYGTIQMLRIVLIAGIIIFPVSFAMAIINKKNY